MDNAQRGAAWWLGLACCIGAVHAQTAAPPAVPTPPVVPPASELAPPRVDGAPAALPARPAPPRELGKPDDDVRLDVVRYALDADAPPELVAALPRLTERFTGKDRGFEDLAAAAAEVTRFLQRDLGYYLGYAYLPEQTPEGGVIRIAVLEGRLDKVVLNWPGNLPVDREVVENYLSRLVPGSVLKVRDVERVVFLVNDLRGITARFEVKAGSAPGTAQLVVTPRAESLWSGKAEADVNGSRFMGQYRVSGLAQRNSPFGRGDGFTANVLASTTGGLGFALLSYTTPVGGNGFKVGASISGVRYQLDKGEFPLGLQGTAVTFNAYGLYPWVRSRNLNLFGLVSLEQKAYEDQQTEAGSKTKKDVSTAALGITGDFRDSLLGGGVNTFDLSLVAGKLKFPEGIPGGVDPEDLNITKATFGFTRLQDVLTGRLLAYTSIRGQWTARNLDTTEQFRIGGPEGVRGYAPGEGTGDMGAILSLEARILPPEDWIGRIAREMVASVFIDAGWIKYRVKPRPAAGAAALANTDVFTAAGIGLAWVRPGEYALRFSLAKPIGGTPRSDPQVKDPRLYLQGTKFFN